ncbi:hypothetical protein M9458_026385, partial [Cirrhinus mrigala]
PHHVMTASVIDPPLMSARMAGIPVVTGPAGLPLSTALPVMAIAILSVWATHCTLEALSVHESVPEASPFHKFAPVPPEVVSPAAEPPEEAASTAEPTEVAASAAEPPKGVVPVHELTASSVMAKEAIHELTASPVMAMEAIHELP